MRPFLSPQIDLDGKVVFVTGGTGSFGRKFCQMVLENYKPRKLIVFSRDELKQYEMQSDPAFRNRSELRFFIGDVRDRGRLEIAMREVDYVVHAAAMKQVTTAEYNPFECIHTNVLGAENVVNAALRCEVKAVIALSTDKAANPINLYGASKLASDKIFVAANNLSGTIGTRFSVVRYGNVVGSRGSVVPLFKKMINEGATKLPVTDDRMTRFWITLDRGVNFVLSSLALMRGGEIFVPKIPSMKVIDLAKAFLPNAEVDLIGIRPGEKLHEVLISQDDARTTIDVDDRFIIQPQHAWWGRGKPYNASPVDPEFLYQSDLNDEWLDVDSLKELLSDDPKYAI